MFDLNRLEPVEWLKLNAALQKKKNALRKSLNQKGILKREGQNTFDHYSYYSEAQYKKLFTELFSASGLELKFNEVSYDTFEGTEKAQNGRLPKIEFTLFDTDTGFFEVTTITGEGMDRGDKAGYKAYTGALKYFLADTFLVATGDDPETESPEVKMNQKAERKATASQVAMIKGLAIDIPAMLNYYGVKKIEDLTVSQASNVISRKGDKANV